MTGKGKGSAHQQSPENVNPAESVAPALSRLVDLTFPPAGEHPEPPNVPTPSEEDFHSCGGTWQHVPKRRLRECGRCGAPERDPLLKILVPLLQDTTSMAEEAEADPPFEKADLVGSLRRALKRMAGRE